jgi:endonuclease/exonuclease/phosphatase family metal-dependent hydrolase
VRVIWYNAFLLHVELPRPGGPITIGAKPAWRARAAEIGRALAGQYEVAALSEVFDEPEREAVLAGWDGRPATHAVGPGRASIPMVGKSSGLVTVTDGLPVVRRAARRFRAKGAHWRDADAFASKGVLLVEADVGAAGNLEVYSTHLIAGNDFLKRPGGPAATATVRHKQVEELVAFIREVHRPGNVALVVGDFNVPAQPADGDERGYERLRRVLDSEGFDDVWAAHGRGPGFTACDGVPGSVCRPDPEAPEYCAEPAVVTPGTRAARIDYAWLQRRHPAHLVAASVTSIRRRSFPRHPGADGYEAAPFLSDHLALDLALHVGSPSPDEDAVIYS